VAVCGLLAATPAFAFGPIAAAGAEAAATAIAQQQQDQQQGQGQQQSGSVNNKSGDSRALALSLGQAATAAQGCMKGTRLGLFGVLPEWTDYSRRCALYEAAAIAEAAAGVAPDQQSANFYYIRANELMARAEGTSIPGN